MSDQSAPDNQPTASLQPGNGGSDVPPTVPMHSDGGSERPGDWIGSYKLLERIGEGGFGVVYLAERREPIVQRVALKIIKQGMDTRAVVARFEQERQALAVMDHPFIAKVFDAGATPAGRPYFVMEHVAGEPITDYADRHNLSVRQRLELFASVCEAVQHAHLKGLIHRDIKPSNILVSVRDGKALPKVIDFGVAKAITHTLTEKTIFTERGQLIGTPEYMSPEQAEMGATDIDTRTDVYSLGVVLYELLSGLLPFDSRAMRSAGFAAICKVLREQDPPKPSTRLSTADAASGADIAKHRQADRRELALELRRELDWIPLKALRKDRTERYQSPSDLARDVRNYLEGNPLDAGPESVTYRVKKFVRRNRGGVLAAAGVAMALVLGLASTLWQAQQAHHEATAARAAEVEQQRLATIASAKATEADAASKRANEARKAAEFEAYLANLIAADASLAANEPVRVRARLDACPEYLRGWEWRWLSALSDRSLGILVAHSQPIVTAKISPDGKYLALASNDSTATVWAIATRTLVATMRGHEQRLMSVGFSPDGALVLTTAADGTARTWSSHTGAPELSIAVGNELVTDACFNPGGTKIATVSDDRILRIWNATTGALLHECTGHEWGYMHSVAFSPDGSRLVTACQDRTARVWDADTGQELLVLRGHIGGVVSAVFSADGKRVLTAAGDRTARVWDIQTGSELAVLRGHEGVVWKASFSPDGNQIATASFDKTARIWNTNDWSTSFELRGAQAYVVSVSFNHDGSRLLTGSSDGIARVWNCRSGEELCHLRGHTGGIVAAAFTADDSTIVTAATDRTARIWSSTTTNAEFSLRGNTVDAHLASLIRPSVAFHPNGQLIATALGDQETRLWSAADGREVLHIPDSQPRETLVMCSPDGKWILSASSFGSAALTDINTTHVWSRLGPTPVGGDAQSISCAAIDHRSSLALVAFSHERVARLWNLGSGAIELESLQGHSDRISAAAFNSDDTLIATGSADRTAILWSRVAGSPRFVLEGHEDRITSVDWSPSDQLIATASADGTVRIWNAETGAEHAILRGHQSCVNTAQFSANGEHIVSGSSDHTARVWSSSGTLLVVLKGHDGGINSARFSPDGTRVLTASADHSVRLWDTESGKEVLILRGHEREVVDALFSPDGTRIVSVSVDGTARVYDSVTYRDRFRQRPTP